MSTAALNQERTNELDVCKPFHHTFYQCSFIFMFVDIRQTPFAPRIPGYHFNEWNPLRSILIAPSPSPVISDATGRDFPNSKSTHHLNCAQNFTFELSLSFSPSNLPRQQCTMIRMIKGIFSSSIPTSSNVVKEEELDEGLDAGKLFVPLVELFAAREMCSLRGRLGMRGQLCELSHFLLQRLFLFAPAARLFTLDFLCLPLLHTLTPCAA